MTPTLAEGVERRPRPSRAGRASATVTVSWYNTVEESRVDELKDRVAVITGSASGIGTGIAEGFAAQGMKLFLADIHEARLEAVADDLRRTGAEVGTLVTDVGDAAAVEALANAADDFGVLGVLCNNVGVLKRGTAWEIPADEWYRIVRVNLMGVVNGVRSFVPRMLATGKPCHIVNTASMSAVAPTKYLATYNATKHAVLGFSETLDNELREAGHPIGITVLMPGPVRTRLGQP